MYLLLFLQDTFFSPLFLQKKNELNTPLLVTDVVIVSAETIITIRQSIHMQTTQQQQFTWFTQKLGYIHQA